MATELKDKRPLTPPCEPILSKRQRMQEAPAAETSGTTEEAHIQGSQALNHSLDIVACLNLELNASRAFEKAYHWHRPSDISVEFASDFEQILSSAVSNAIRETIYALNYHLDTVAYRNLELNVLRTFGEAYHQHWPRELFSDAAYDFKHTLISAVLKVIRGPPHYNFGRLIASANVGNDREPITTPIKANVLATPPHSEIKSKGTTEVPLSPLSNRVSLGTRQPNVKHENAEIIGHAGVGVGDSGAGDSGISESLETTSAESLIVEEKDRLAEIEKYISKSKTGYFSGTLSIPDQNFKDKRIASIVVSKISASGGFYNGCSQCKKVSCDHQAVPKEEFPVLDAEIYGVNDDDPIRLRIFEGQLTKIYGDSTEYISNLELFYERLGSVYGIPFVVRVTCKLYSGNRDFKFRSFDKFRGLKPEELEILRGLVQQS